MGDKAGSAAFFAQAARYYWTFYGQLAAGQAGLSEIRLGADPAVSEADSGRFEASELVQAARILAQLGERDLVRVFVLYADDGLTAPADFVQLVDLARANNDPDLTLRVVRTAAQKGVAMPTRGYPLRAAPDVATSAEPALILAITRQAAEAS